MVSCVTSSRLGMCHTYTCVLHLPLHCVWVEILEFQRMLGRQDGEAQHVDLHVARWLCLGRESDGPRLELGLQRCRRNSNTATRSTSCETIKQIEHTPREGCIVHGADAPSLSARRVAPTAPCDGATNRSPARWCLSFDATALNAGDWPHGSFDPLPALALAIAPAPAPAPAPGPV